MHILHTLTFEVVRVFLVLIHVLRDRLRPHQEGRRNLFRRRRNIVERRTTRDQ